MKTDLIKISLILFVSSITFSCHKKQNWNCSCTASASINPNGTAPIYTTTVENANNANAKDLCNKWGGQQMPSNSYTCTVSAE